MAAATSARRKYGIDCQAPVAEQGEPALLLASRLAQAATCSGGGDAGARYGSFVFTNAQASVSSLRAAAQRATFIGLPATRKRS